MNLSSEIIKCHDRASRSDRKDLVTSWTEKELWKNEIKDVFSVIFRTKGCYWSDKEGCSMCGYYTDTNPDSTEEDLLEQLETARERYGGEEIVKIYTSGSFLDTGEVPERLALDILDSFDAEKVLVESRPEFVTEDKILDYSSKTNKLEIAIGLESANDFVLENSINKGFNFSDYQDAKDLILKNDLLLRTYLLLKPPFITEKEAIEDVIESIKKIQHPYNIISINPVNVQKGSLVEKLWYNKSYRPPWIWSILDILSNVDSKSMIVCSRAGLGSEKGAHNCGECDDRLISKIDEFNLSQDKDILKNIESDIDCNCHSTWKKEIELEPFLQFRGSIDILSNRYTGYV